MSWISPDVQPSVSQVTHMAVINYSKALRAIGQDLEIRDIKSLDLRYRDNNYIVQCGYQPPPSPIPVTLHYSSEDVDRLDREGQQKRRASPGGTELLTLSHLLKGIGGYLEKRKARLLRISNNDSRGSAGVFTIEYETAGGERVVEERSVSSIYDLCVNMYRQREKNPSAADKYRRWRR